ncbi:MAG: response regulator [Cytophagaceae bacterium]
MENKKLDLLFLIDDDQIYQFLTQRIIEETRLINKIKAFFNGKEALDFMNSIEGDLEQLPDIILLDLSMPIMDGWQFLEEFVQMKPFLGKKIVIYIVTSSNAPSDIQRAKSISDVSDFIIKPITKEGFIDMVKKIGSRLNEE